MSINGQVGLQNILFFSYANTKIKNTSHIQRWQLYNLGVNFSLCLYINDPNVQPKLK